MRKNEGGKPVCNIICFSIHVYGLSVEGINERERENDQVLVFFSSSFFLYVPIEINMHL